MLFRRQPSCGEGCNGHLSVQVFVALASSKNVRGQSTVLTTIGHPSCHGRVSIGVQSSLSKGRGLSEPSKISNGLHEAKVVILVSADMRPNVCDCFGATLKLVECDSNECPPPPRHCATALREIHLLVIPDPSTVSGFQLVLQRRLFSLITAVKKKWQ